MVGSIPSVSLETVKEGQEPSIKIPQRRMDPVSFNLMKVNLQALEAVQWKLMEDYRRLLHVHEINIVKTAAQLGTITAEDGHNLMTNGISTLRMGVIALKLGIIPGAHEHDQLSKTMHAIKELIEFYRDLYGWI